MQEEELNYADQVILELSEQKQTQIIDGWDAYDNNGYDKHTNIP